MRTAWQQLDVSQCGYCQSGQIMAAVGAAGRDAEADAMPTSTPAMTGNICRCATYHRIRAAVHEAARLMEA